jgi:O-antigen ligase
MAPLREDLWRPGRDLPFLVLCAALAASMIRSSDQPSFDVGVGGTEVALVPADVALATLGAVCVGRLAGRGSLPHPARAVAAAAAAFSLWLFASSAVNGADALVGTGKLLEYGTLGLGAVLFVRRRAQLWQVVGLVVAVTIAADLVALPGFAGDLGERQDSFLGGHDFAALGTMALSVAFAAMFAPAHRLGRFPLVAGIAGGIAIVLGAALASLVGLGLAAAAVVGLARARGAATPRRVAAVAVVLLVVAAGTISIRWSDLGFLRTDGADEALSTERAGGWSQRLIYAYLGGRVFLDNPIVGTGWHGELPPAEWARYLDDAKRRFDDQPEHYFPGPDDTLIPQQTYDQVLYELGIVGALLFLALAVVVVRTALRIGLAWPRQGPDEAVAYVPAAWTASLAGALSGAALFGGIPLMSIFWLTLGVVALTPSLMPPPAAVTAPRPRREPAAVG